MESTFNWYWLVDGLMEAGYRVHLANTAAIQQYAGLSYTGVYRRSQRCPLVSASFAIGVMTRGVYLPEGGAGGTGSIYQIKPDHAPFGTTRAWKGGSVHKSQRSCEKNYCEIGASEAKVPRVAFVETID